MISFELTQQLQKSGFKQELGIDVYDEVKTGREGYTKEGKETVYDDGFWRGGDAMVTIPTLFELIEACGNGFGGIIKVDNGYKAFEMVKWDSVRPVYSMISFIEGFIGHGETMEEAVADLWLKINAK